MARYAMRGLAGVVVFLLLLPALVAQEDPAPPATSRDCYLEGWFHETSGGSLDTALEHYRRAVEIDDDDEMVARAMWRMGMILRARGETGKAAEILDRVLSEFAGTRAAALAQEALQTSEAPPAGKESERVEAARQVLRQVLAMVGKNVTINQLKIVFENLSVAQILEECEWANTDLADALHFKGKSVSAPGKKLELVLACDLERNTPNGFLLASTAVKSLNLSSAEPVPEALYSLVDRGPLREVLFEQLIQRRDRRSMQTILELIERYPDLKAPTEPPFVSATMWPTLTALMNREPADTAEADLIVEVLDAVFADVLRSDEALRDFGERQGTNPQSFFLRTPAGDWLRGLFPRFSPQRRLYIAEYVSGAGPERGVDLDLLELFLEDREPLVRHEALSRMLWIGDEEVRRAALARIHRQPPVSRVQLMSTAVDRRDPAFPMADLVAVPLSDLREFAYVRAIGWSQGRQEPGRSLFEVIAFGLERGDRELLKAVFGTDLSYRAEYRSANVFSQAGNVRQVFERGVVQSEHETLAARLIRAGLEDPSDLVRLQAAQLMMSLWPQPGLEECAALASADVNPAVRQSLASADRFPELPVAVQSRLLADLSKRVCRDALRRVQDPRALIEAIPAVPAARLEDVFLHSPRRGETFPLQEDAGVLHRAYEVAPPDSALALHCFEKLHVRDVDVLIDGMARPEAPVRSRARQLLAALDLGSELWRGFAGQPFVETDLERSRRFRDRLVEHRDVVLAALTRHQIQQVLTEMRQNTKEHHGVRLAELGARDELRELALDETDNEAARAGARGLEDLGDVEGLRMAVQRRVRIDVVLPYAFRAGLDDEVFLLARLGRVRPELLLSALVNADHDEGLVRLMRDHPELVAAGNQQISRLVEAVEREDDPPLLARAARITLQAPPVSKLFRLGEYELILDELPNWGGHARLTAMQELHRLTGVSGGTEWPRFLEEQEALVAAWREALPR